MTFTPTCGLHNLKHLWDRYLLTHGMDVWRGNSCMYVLPSLPVPTLSNPGAGDPWTGTRASMDLLSSPFVFFCSLSASFREQQDKPRKGIGTGMGMGIEWRDMDGIGLEGATGHIPPPKFLWLILARLVYHPSICSYGRGSFVRGVVISVSSRVEDALREKEEEEKKRRGNKRTGFRYSGRADGATLGAFRRGLLKPGSPGSPAWSGSRVHPG